MRIPMMGTSQVAKSPNKQPVKNAMLMVHLMKYVYRLMAYHFASDRIFGVCSFASRISEDIQIHTKNI